MSLDHLLAQWGDIPFTEFDPYARYYEAMDVVLYLQEDVSYRADRVDGYLTLLWHPHEDRAIGVKLKGWRHLFTRLQRIVEATGASLPDSQFVTLISALELALESGQGDDVTADAERVRKAAKYKKALEIVDGVNVDRRELLQAA